MTYKLPNTVNKNRIFILQKSELEKRLDPYYYYEIMNNKIVFSCVSSKLSKLTKTYSGGTPSKEKQEYWNGNILWASPKDMKEFYLSDTEDKITESGLKNSATTLAPQGSLVIVFRSGILQHTLPVAITTKDTAINQDLKVIIPNNDILPEFLAVYFRVFQNRIIPRIVKHSTTVQSINQEEFDSLPIPVPDKQIQKQIVDIHKKAIDHKAQAEAQAEALLASIDDYLLGELGITLPDKTSNTIKDRIFITNFKKITQQRFDPTFHRLNYEKFRNSIMISPFKAKKLKDIVTYLDYGLMPTQDYAFSENDGLPMIRVTNITKSGYINMEKTEFIKFDTPKLYDKLVQENDILMVQCGNTTGKCAMVTKEFVGYTFGSFSFGIRSDPEIISQYFLFYLLNSQIVQEQLNRSITITSVRPNTSKPEVENFLIPIPPLSKQQEISERITAIRNQAQELRKSADSAMKKASAEIEMILLGNE